MIFLFCPCLAWRSVVSQDEKKAELTGSRSEYTTDDLDVDECLASRDMTSETRNEQNPIPPQSGETGAENPPDCCFKIHDRKIATSTNYLTNSK